MAKKKSFSYTKANNVLTAKAFQKAEGGPLGDNNGSYPSGDLWDQSNYIWDHSKNYGENDAVQVRPLFENNSDTWRFGNITEAVKNGEPYLYNQDSASNRYFVNSETGDILSMFPHNFQGTMDEFMLDGYTEVPYKTLRKDYLPKRDYIGGDGDRQNILSRLPGVRDAVAKVASAYGVSPNLMLHRMATEGFADKVIKIYNAMPVKDQKALMNDADFKMLTSLFSDGLYNGFLDFGLDDAGYMLESGKMSLKNPKAFWEAVDAENEKGRQVRSVVTDDFNTILEILAADTAYRQNNLLERGFSKDNIDTYTSAAANLGLFHNNLGNSNYVMSKYGNIPNYMSYNLHAGGGGIGEGNEEIPTSSAISDEEYLDNIISAQSLGITRNLADEYSNRDIRRQAREDAWNPNLESRIASGELAMIPDEGNERDKKIYDRVFNRVHARNIKHGIENDRTRRAINAIHTGDAEGFSRAILEKRDRESLPRLINMFSAATLPISLAELASLGITGAGRALLGSAKNVTGETLETLSAPYNPRLWGDAAAKLTRSIFKGSESTANAARLAGQYAAPLADALFTYEGAKSANNRLHRNLNGDFNISDVPGYAMDALGMAAFTGVIQGAKDYYNAIKQSPLGLKLYHLSPSYFKEMDDYFYNKSRDLESIAREAILLPFRGTNFDEAGSKKLLNAMLDGDFGTEAKTLAESEEFKKILTQRERLRNTKKFIENSIIGDSYTGRTIEADSYIKPIFEDYEDILDSRGSKISTYLGLDGKTYSDSISIDYGEQLPAFKYHALLNNDTKVSALDNSKVRFKGYSPKEFGEATNEFFKDYEILGISSIPEVKKQDYETLQSYAGDNGIIAGSYSVLKDRGSLREPDDVEFLTTESRFENLRESLGLKHTGYSVGSSGNRTFRSDSSSKIKKKVEIEVIEEDPITHTAKGTVAKEVYMLLDPLGYNNQLKSESEAFIVPYTPEQIYQQFKNNPELMKMKTILDNISSGKGKHNSRIFSIITKDSEMVDKAVTTKELAYLGQDFYQYEQRLLQSIDFTDIDANRKFCKALSLPTRYADNPEVMKTLYREWKFETCCPTRRHNTAHRSREENTNHLLWNINDRGVHIGGNFVQNSKNGGGESYGNELGIVYIPLSYNESSFTNVMDAYKAFERSQNTDKMIASIFTKEQIDYLNNLPDFSHIEDTIPVDYLYRVLNDYQSKLLHQYAYSPLEVKHIMNDISKVLDIPAVRKTSDFKFVSFEGDTQMGGYIGNLDGELKYYGYTDSNRLDNAPIEPGGMFPNHLGKSADYYDYRLASDISEDSIQHSILLKHTKDILKNDSEVQKASGITDSKTYDQFLDFVLGTSYKGKQTISSKYDSNINAHNDFLIQEMDIVDDLNSIQEASGIIMGGLAGSAALLNTAELFEHIQNNKKDKDDFRESLDSVDTVTDVINKALQIRNTDSYKNLSSSDKNLIDHRIIQLSRASQESRKYTNSIEEALAHKKELNDLVRSDLARDITCFRIFYNEIDRRKIETGKELTKEERKALSELVEQVCNSIFNEDK